jgi:hypothetical protein
MAGHRALAKRCIVRSGKKAKYSLRADVFRFGPESGLNSDITACPKSAISGLMHRSKGLFDDLVGQREQH